MEAKPESDFMSALNYHKSSKYAEIHILKKKNNVNFINVSLVAVQNVGLTWV
jgi:hypothetical protein